MTKATIFVLACEMALTGAGLLGCGPKVPIKDEPGGIMSGTEVERKHSAERTNPLAVNQTSAQGGTNSSYNMSAVTRPIAPSTVPSLTPAPGPTPTPATAPAVSPAPANPPAP